MLQNVNMLQKHQKPISCLNHSHSDQKFSLASRPTDSCITQTLGSGNVGHCINNPLNSIFLDSQSLVKIWGLVIPVLDEKAEREDSLVIAGHPFQELKKEMIKLFTRIERNTRRVRRVVEDLQECDLHVR